MITKLDKSLPIAIRATVLIDELSRKKNNLTEQLKEREDAETRRERDRLGLAISALWKLL